MAMIFHAKGRVTSLCLSASSAFLTRCHYLPLNSVIHHRRFKDLTSLPIGVRTIELPIGRVLGDASRLAFPSSPEVTMAHHVQNKEDLASKLAEAGENLVVIDFSATWCGPCKMIGPIFEGMAADFPNVVFLKVDVDECDEIASEYGITSMPTFIFIKKSQKISTFSGANAEKLRQTIMSLK